MTESNKHPQPNAQADGSLSMPAPETVTHEDGTVTISAPNGAQLITQLDGSIRLDCHGIKQVGVRDIMAIESHTITHLLGMAAHFVKFRSGAELRYSYNQQGQAIELSFAGLDAKMTADGQLMFSVGDAGEPSQIEFEMTLPSA